MLLFFRLKSRSSDQLPLECSAIWQKQVESLEEAVTAGVLTSIATLTLRRRVGCQSEIEHIVAIVRQNGAVQWTENLSLCFALRFFNGDPAT